MTEPHLPDGTPTRNLPCRFCGHPKSDHNGWCFGSLRDTPKSFQMSDVALDNLRRGDFHLPLTTTTPVQPACVHHCRVFCPPGGIEILT